MQKRIMLIMPDDKTGSRYSDFLDEMGYRVNLLDNPKLAVTHSNYFKPNLVICHEECCGENGTSLATSFKTNAGSKDIPFLLLSNQPPTEDGVDLSQFGHGVDDLIHAPIEQAELYGYVTNWLESDRPAPMTNLKAYNEPVVENQTEKIKQPWSKGTVNLFSVGKLLSKIMNNNLSGTLLLKGERRKMKVLIENGTVIDVQSNYIREDTLGRYLVSINKLSDEDNKKSLEYAKNYQIPQGEAIVASGLMETDELVSHITQHKIIKLLNLFQRRWYKSKFVFNQDKLGARSRDFRATPLQKILEMGLMNIARKKDIYDVFFTKNKEKAKLHLCGDFHDVAHRLDIGPALTDNATKINGLSIEEIKNRWADKFEHNLRLAFLLVVSKGMSFA